MRRRLAPILIASTLAATPAMAEDICNATAVRSALATEESFRLEAGKKLSAVSQFVIRPSGMYICQHGGGCYAAFTVEDGQWLANFKFENCTVDFSKGETSFGETTYYFKVDRTRANKVDLRYQDISNRLVDLGLGLAPASHAALAYLQRPDSQCGQLTRMVIEGNPDALRTMLGARNACSIEWNRQ